MVFVQIMLNCLPKFGPPNLTWRNEGAGLYEQWCVDLYMYVNINTHLYTYVCLTYLTLVASRDTCDALFVASGDDCDRLSVPKSHVFMNCYFYAGQAVFVVK